VATVHHTKGFFIGLVDPDPGFAKMAPTEKKAKKCTYYVISAG
jgi:hypothetical protein